MKLLRDILYKVALNVVFGSTNTSISGLQSDSRLIQKDHLFVAIKGLESDGHQYINQAIEKGASVIVHQQHIKIKQSAITYVPVSYTHLTLPTSPKV